MNSEIEENGLREGERETNTNGKKAKAKVKENGDEHNRSIFLAGYCYHHSRSSVECQFTILCRSNLQCERFTFYQFDERQAIAVQSH